ncbi:antiterminator LoaP [Parolsenella catena]|uniref:antiterminator LoaP n=1 Tax=Parolsenella catena TaxID=2003188 RepID=UPI003F9E531D
MALYVMQVLSGREAKVVDLVTRVAGDLANECFAPKREKAIKLKGVWERKSEFLFPGYVIVDTSRPQELSELLRKSQMVLRLLGAPGKVCEPLSEDEAHWLSTMTNAKTHELEMSEGLIEGGKVIVTDGPLKGHEALISKIDRHKRLAWLDIHMFGRTKSIRAGLEIVSKRD